MLTLEDAVAIAMLHNPAVEISSLQRVIDKFSLKLAYNNFVPLDLNHAYEKITSCESSLGISLNSEIQNIIEDTVNIFLNLSIIPVSNKEDPPVLADYTTYDGVDVNFRNFEFRNLNFRGGGF